MLTADQFLAEMTQHIEQRSDFSSAEAETMAYMGLGEMLRMERIEYGHGAYSWEAHDAVEIAEDFCLCGE